MRSSTAVALLVSAVLVTTGSGLADKPQTTCPVMGGEINKEVYADYAGSGVYFCCPGCKEPFLKEAESFLKKMKEEGFVPEKTPNPQTHCPVMGGEVNRQVYLDHKGKRVYFCCENCMGKFKAEPEKYLKKLEDEGVDLEDTQSLKRFERGASEGENTLTSTELTEPPASPFKGEAGGKNN